jgi:hypothetical protein
LMRAAHKRSVAARGSGGRDTREKKESDGFIATESEAFPPND